MAEGTVLRCGRRVGFSGGKLFDSQGKLLAHGTTMCLFFETWSSACGGFDWRISSIKFELTALTQPTELAIQRSLSDSLQSAPLMLIS